MFIDHETTTNWHSFRSAMLRATVIESVDEFEVRADDRHRTPKGVPNFQTRRNYKHLTPLE